MKLNVRSDKQEVCTSLSERALKVEQDQTPHTLKAIQDVKMPGVSLWLHALSFSEFGFALNKGQFRDALALKGLPAVCPWCGLAAKTYNVTHALNCKKGGFVTMWHNNFRDFEAEIFSKIVNDVEAEPQLQLVAGEIIEGLSRNTSRSGIRARGVWRAGHSAVFGVRVTNTHSPSQIQLTTESVLKKHEQEKKRNYNRHIMNIEHGTFASLVFSISGGMGMEYSLFISM